MAATGTRIVPKSLTPTFDRAAVLAKLFALPVPPPPGDHDRTGGRTYPIDTPLGRIMRIKGLKVQELQRFPDCPNHRVLSDYLAGRKPISPRHRGALARALGVDSRIL